MICNPLVLVIILREPHTSNSTYRSHMHILTMMASRYAAGCEHNMMFLKSSGNCSLMAQYIFMQLFVLSPGINTITNTSITTADRTSVRVIIMITLYILRLPLMPLLLLVLPRLQQLHLLRLQLLAVIYDSITTRAFCKTHVY